MGVASIITVLQRPTTVNRRIFHAAATVGVFTVLTKAVAMAKELAVANYFGRGDAIDAFLFAFMVPAFAVTLIVLSMNAALIPTYIEVREHEGKEAAQRLLSSSTLWCQMLALGLSLLMAVAGPALLHALAPSFGEAKLALTVHLFYAMLPIIVLTAVSGCCGAVLNASGCFWLPAITPMLTPIVTLLLLLGTPRLGVWALVIGVVSGALFETVVLAAALAGRGISIMPRWWGSSTALQQVRSQYIALLFGGVLTSGVTIVDQTMAAWLQPGSVAALAYGNRIVGVIVGVAATSLTAAVVPCFSEMIAKAQWEQCRHTLNTYTRLIVAVMLPVSVVIVAGSPWIVRLMFQRGAFTAADTALVARVQAMLALQIPFYAAGLLHVRLLTALKRNDLVMISAAINLGLDVILNLICMRFFGLPGIALSTSLFYVGSLGFATVMARRLLREAPLTAALHVRNEACA
jgi:putative peptidoglycan lipid II flippase